MRVAGLLVLLGAAMCGSPYGARIRADHARQFGCQERWVRADHQGQGRWQATGCGFLSEWVCRDRACAMQDHRSYGVDSP